MRGGMGEFCTEHHTLWTFYLFGDIWYYLYSYYTIADLGVHCHFSCYLMFSQDQNQWAGG